MRLKELVTAAVCVTAIGGAVGVTPAVAKNDKPKKVKECNPHSNGRFKCETVDGTTILSACPSGYSASTVFDAGIDVDLNGNYVVCTDSSGNSVDDTPVS